MSNPETLETLRRLGPEQVLNGRELCPCCDSLSPGIAMDGETIVHCPVCHDLRFVSVEQAERWRREMQENMAASKATGQAYQATGKATALRASAAAPGSW